MLQRQILGKKVTTFFLWFQNEKANLKFHKIKLPKATWENPETVYQAFFFFLIFLGNQTKSESKNLHSLGKLLDGRFNVAASTHWSRHWEPFQNFLKHTGFTTQQTKTTPFRNWECLDWPFQMLSFWFSPFFSFFFRQRTIRIEFVPELFSTWQFDFPFFFLFFFFAETHPNF